MLKKLLLFFCLLVSGTQVFAEDLSNLVGWYVVQISINRPLTLSAETLMSDSILYKKYFVEGKSQDTAPAESPFGKEAGPIDAFTKASCEMVGHSQLHVSKSQIIIHQARSFLGVDEQVLYVGRNSQATSMRVANNYGVYEAYIDVDGGYIHCFSKTPVTQELLNSILGDSEVSSYVLRPCRYDNLGNGLQKRICE